MQRIPCVSIIVENMDGDVLLLLRDNQSTTVYPNHWTLIGGTVENGETPEMAALRELQAETGYKTKLSLWKRYERQHSLFVVDQYIYTGTVDAGGMLIIARDLQFFKPYDIKYLKIGYGFDALLSEYFLLGKQ